MHFTWNNATIPNEVSSTNVDLQLRSRLRYKCRAYAYHWEIAYVVKYKKNHLQQFKHFWTEQLKKTPHPHRVICARTEKIYLKYFDSFDCECFCSLHHTACRLPLIHCSVFRLCCECATAKNVHFNRTTNWIPFVYYSRRHYAIHSFKWNCLI